ncbi:SpoIID/LytB domain-containing protein [Parelusimicrobium proximum]|uniref:SpoIID/LytB domain-containing protein n=1 Tax=Parelusimicrobium proximum TaxID=3228953 RepID=UPI003D173F5D
MKNNIKKPLLSLIFLSPALCLGALEVTTTINPEPAMRSIQASELPFSNNTVITYSRHPDIRLNNDLIRRSVMNYTLPPALERVNQKCKSVTSEECFFNYKPFEHDEDKTVAMQANTELAFLSLQMGEIKNAVEYIEKASSFSPDDPFLELAKGWFYLSSGSYKKAKASFDRIPFLSADFEYVSYARLGSAYAKYYLKDRDGAMEDFAYIYSSYPYMISLASHMMAKITYEKGKKKERKAVVIYEEQSLSHDVRNLPATKQLAQAEEKLKERRSAWQHYAIIYSYDMTDKKTAKKLKKLSKDFRLDPINYMYYARISQPLLRKYDSYKSPSVSMLLYAGMDNGEVPLTEVEIMPSAKAEIRNDKLSQPLKMDTYATKKIVFNKEHAGVSVKDAWGNVDLASVTPLDIYVPDGYTMLIKNPKAENIFATDLSDKEIKGSLRIVPVEGGFLIINRVMTEDLLPSLLYSSTYKEEGPETLKALTIVLRSYLAKLMSEPRKKGVYDITDNEHGIKFSGVNLEAPEYAKAVAATRKIHVDTSEPYFYEDCGVLTEGGVRNTSARFGYTFSPSNVFKYILSNPPLDLLSSPADATQWARIKWNYLYDIKDIERRANNIKKIGRITGIVQENSSDDGRVLKLLIKGKKGDIEVSAENISHMLGAYTLRSNFFTIIPIYKGKKIRNLLLMGVDTGYGNGLCISGADGLERKGFNYMKILEYYFPGSGIAVSNK